MARSDEFLRELRAEFPSFRVVPKAGHSLSLAIDRVLKLVTFGGQRHYLTRYHTVLGDTLYVPGSWDSMSDMDRVILLRHERVHLRQRRRLGTLRMALAYLFMFAPLGLAWGRARLEWEAYRETLRATAELRGLDAARNEALKREIVSRFVGPDYGWMWPFRTQVERWYDAALTDIEAEMAGTGEAERPCVLTGSRAHSSPAGDP